MSLLTRNARGVYPIAVTPFADSGAIDYASVDRLLDFYLECGAPGVTLLGVLGEANKLSEEESLELTRHALRRIGGRGDIVVGTNHTGFENFHRFVSKVMEAGASAVMIAPARGLATEEQVCNFFGELVGTIGTGVPLVLQDYPQNTGVYLSVDTMERLVKEFDSIKVIKHEEGSALRKVTRLRAQEQAGRRERVSILVGNSGIHLPQELHRGVDGANTGVAFPEMLVEVCERFSSGKPEEGEDLYDLFLPLIRHEQQPGIGLAIRKEIFRRRGLIDSARVRSPGPRLNGDDHAELGRLLARLDRKLRDSGEQQIISSYPVQALDSVRA